MGKRKEKPAKPLKAALYVRVSTVYQLDKDSLPIQRQDLINYAQLILGITDYEIFEDAGYSGKNTDRPNYQLMMSRIRSGEFSHLLVWKIDRISRNLLDFAAMYAELKKLKVTFVSKNEQFDTSSAMGEAMLKIILVFAELERAMTSERVSQILATKAENGGWNGGRVPFGYTHNKETDTFEILPDEGKIVRLIYDKYLETESTLATTRYLNELKIITRSGNEWSVVTVHKILTSIWYVGDYQYVRKNNIDNIPDEAQTIIFTNHHPALIDRLTSETVKNILKSNLSENNHRKTIYALSNLLVCEKCRHSYNPYHIKGRLAYRCFSNTKNTDCDNPFVYDSNIMPFILNFVSNFIYAKAHKEEFTDLDKFRKSLLIGKRLETVRRIGGDIEKAHALLDSSESFFEFVPQTSQDSLRDIISAQKDKHLLILKRLNTSLLSGLIDQEEYSRRKQTELEALQTLETTIAPDLDIKIEADRETEAFSILADFICNHKNFYPAICDSLQGSRTVKDFLHRIIRNILIYNGRISEIEFTNKLSFYFRY